MSLLPKSIHRCRRYPTKFNSGRDIPDEPALAGNAKPRPRFERQVWTRVPAIFIVMDIQWGVALLAPVQGPMQHHIRRQQ